MPRRAYDLFISFAHEDEPLRAQLDKHLALLKRRGEIRVWHYREIAAGEDWRGQVDDRLDAADLILLLVSPSFLDSDYCFDVETTRAVERHSQKAALVIPVIVRPCDWGSAPFAKLQTLPKDGKPVTMWRNSDEAWLNVTRGLKEVITSLRAENLVSAKERRRRKHLHEPLYADDESRQLSRQLKTLFQRRRRWTIEGRDTQVIEDEILQVRRLLRKGPQLRPGEFLGNGRYELLEVIGRGGFATVWRAWDTGGEMLVALKILHGHWSEDRSKRERFFRGARVMASLAHPRVVRVLDSKHSDDGWYFFVMEHLGGGNFEEAVLRGELTPERRMETLIQIGEALDFAHQNGVVHRDVKPSNILLDEKGAAKLSDFDLVRATDTTGLTATQAMMGTILYAAPEALESAGAVDAAADVYSLGSTVVFALAGEPLPPWYYRDPARAISSLECDEELKRILGRSTAVEARERLDSVTELCQALEALALLPSLRVATSSDRHEVVASDRQINGSHPDSRRTRPSRTQMGGHPSESAVVPIGDKEPGDESDPIVEPSAFSPQFASMQGRDRREVKRAEHEKVGLLSRRILTVVALLAVMVFLTGLWLSRMKSPVAENGRWRAVDTILQADVQAFLDTYTARYLELDTAASEAEWELNVHIVEGDDTNRRRLEKAKAAMAAFTGSQENIDRARSYLERIDALEPIQVLQLEKVLYHAANNPQTVPKLLERRFAAEAVQVETLFGFKFKLDGEPISANGIDGKLVESNDLAERLAVWRASKEVGKELKDGLAELVDLRNRTVQALGYDDYFAYQVSDYGMSVEEMVELNRGFVRDIWPLYRQLHTWARYELAERYGAEVPEMLPAHWLPDRWGQDWRPLVTVKGFDVDAALADKEAEWIVRQAEAFYVSLGFDPLPESFWQKSSLYPLPPDADYEKNNHASAWHIDLRHDVRCLMSVESNERWWLNTHHELGHAYYFMAYSRPTVPPLLRRGANRGFHEVVGTMLGQASLQKPFLVERGLLSADIEADPVQTLLKEALDQIVFIPWSAGVMTHFERDLYDGLPAEDFNHRWWQHVASFQGIAPPAERGEEYCDACTKTHVNDDAAQYYDYAISAIILYQIRQHVAEKILGQDPYATNYWGREDVGAFLKGILELGATRDWRLVMREHLGEGFSVEPMLAYFSPLADALEEMNRGREHTLRQLPRLITHDSRPRETKPSAGREVSDADLAQHRNKLKVGHFR